MIADAMPRVGVTGLGAVSALGASVPALWRGLLSGRTGIRRISRFPVDDYPTVVAAEADPLDLGDDGGTRVGLTDRFAAAAAREAWAAAGLDARLAGRRVGVFWGSSTGGMFESESTYAGLSGRRLSRRDTPVFAAQPVSAPADHVARILGVTGPVETISSACAAATMALESALLALRGGRVDVAIVGGADSLCRVTFGGFNALQSVSPEPCLPFRASRRGLSLGEGAAALVLERAGVVPDGGIQPVAELAGAACTSDAHHMTAPDPDGRGAARALRGALSDAGLEPSAVDFVNAHGTGTPLNDRAEHTALLDVFGDRAVTIPISCTKGSTGHLLGSAGAIEAVITVLCLAEGVIPAAPGGGDVDPEPGLNVVLGEPLAAPDLHVGASLNLAFGGCNAAAIFARWDES